MIAALACETGIAPAQLLHEPSTMLTTMLAYLRWRNTRRR